jgi:hypothetical protein
MSERESTKSGSIIIAVVAVVAVLAVLLVAGICFSGFLFLFFA